MPCSVSSKWNPLAIHLFSHLGFIERLNVLWNSHSIRVNKHKINSQEFNEKIIWQFPINTYIISKFMNLMTIIHKNKSNWHVLWGQSQQHLSHRYWGWSKRSRQQVFTILIYTLTLKTSSAIELIPASFKAVIIAPTVAFLLAISWNKSKLIFLTTAFARNEQKTLEKICEP